MVKKTTQNICYLIPLKTVNAPGGVEVAVSQVEIDWHTSSNSGSFTFPTPSQLPAGSGWGGAPALIRAQVIPVAKANINVNDVNSNSAVAFLYPINSTVVGDVNIADANIIPQGQKNDPTPRNANCQGNAWVSAQYYCRTNLINLPNNNDLNYDLYLRITPLYNNASFRVIAKDSAGNNLTFHNVQPEIDSTGRANNIFRRLKQRVQYETPSGEDLAKNGGFDFTDGFCKNFNITNSDSDYNDGCTPQN